MKRTNFYSNILVLFFIIILAVPVYWLARGKVEPQRSYMEYKTLTVFPTLSFNSFKSAVKSVLMLRFEEAGEKFFNQFRDLSYQTDFQRAASQQFPFRGAGIRLSRDLDRLMIRTAYAFTSDTAIPADRREQVFLTKDTKVLFPIPAKWTTTAKEDINLKIEDYRILIEQNPDIHFYVFYVELIENSLANPMNQYYYNANQGREFAYFLENKPEDLTVSSFPLTSFDDQIKYFYRTDHHWNVHGMLEGYERVYPMLAENYPDMSAMIPHTSFYTFPDIEFHGRWARSVYFKVHPGDVFEVAVLDLPPYKILDQNGNEITYNKKNEYHAGNYSREAFADHYIEYNGADTGYLEYVFDNDSERNLLIIGDSLTNAIEPLIAAHYQHTYAVDIRHWKDYYFSFSDFISEHPVDDVLVLGGAGSTMHRWRWTISP